MFTFSKKNPKPARYTIIGRAVAFKRHDGRRWLLKSLVRSFLHRRGLELKLIGAPIRGPENYIHFLKNQGFMPGTVIDVGVAEGTPWLYQFPDAKLILVEPNDDFEPSLRELERRYKADVFICAVGASEGQLSLNVDMTAPSSSSLLRLSDEVRSYWRRRGRPFASEAKAVQVKPLDDLINDRYAPPFLVKIDTEGFELEVLKGAEQTLDRTDYLIVEASIARRHEKSYDFAELIHFLADREFHLRDIVDIAVFDRDGEISYMDVVFAKAMKRVSAS